MKDIFEMVEKVFGQTTLQFVVAVALLYFAVLGVIRAIDAARALVVNRVSIDRERALLEILKLRYEIEVIRSSNGLGEIPSPELTSILKSRNAVLTDAEAPPANSRRTGVVTYLHAVMDWFGFVALSTIGWLLILTVAISLVSVLADGGKIMEGLHVPAAFFLAGIVLLYVAFQRVGRRLRRNSPLFYLGVAILCPFPTVIWFVWVYMFGRI